MNANELRKILEKMVAEEVRKQLPGIISEQLKVQVPAILAEAFGGKASPRPVATYVPTPLSEPKRTTPVAPKIITKNPLLNQVLSETVGGIPSESSMGGSYEKVSFDQIPLAKINEITANQDTRQLMQEQVAPQPQIDTSGLTREQGAVVGAMTRDYRSMMKAVDAKKRRGVVGSSLVALDNSAE